MKLSYLCTAEYSLTCTEKQQQQTQWREWILPVVVISGMDDKRSVRQLDQQNHDLQDKYE